MCRISRLRVPIVTEWRSLKWTATRKATGHLTAVLTSRPLRRSASRLVHADASSFAVKKPAKHAELKSVGYFQRMQRSKRQWCLNAVQTGLGGARVRVPYVTRNEKAAVGIVAHPCQDDDSSRSSNTRFGMILFPNIRLARASTSGHLTRFNEAGAGVRSSSSARMISTNLRRSRAGNALTCSTSSAVLIKQ